METLAGREPLRALFQNVHTRKEFDVDIRPLRRHACMQVQPSHDALHRQGRGRVFSPSPVRISNFKPYQSKSPGGHVASSAVAF